MDYNNFKSRLNFLKTTHKILFVGFFVLAVVAITSISYFQTQNQVKRPQNAKASEIVDATVAIIPNTVALPPDQTFQVQIKSESEVAFAKIILTFDITKIKLKEEVSMVESAFTINTIPPSSSTSTPLTNLVEKTSLSQANLTGVITIAVGLHPDQKAIPPKGTFQLASLVFTPIITTNTTTELQIPTSTVHLVDINANVMSHQTQNTTLSLNQPSSTLPPIPTSTPLPLVTPINTPSSTPSFLPTNTPTLLPTITPSPQPSSTPIPTVPPVSGSSVIVIYAGGTPSEDIFPNMQLILNNKAVASWSNINADGTKRQTQKYTYTSSTKISDWKQIKVVFTNDKKTSKTEDRNLFVDKITLDGVTRETEAPTTYTTTNKGSFPKYRKSEWLYWNGSFTY